MHRIRDYDVFLQTGYDVMVIPPLGGAVHHFQWRILKGWPQVYMHALLIYFAYLQPLKSYSTFSFWLGFPDCRLNVWGFRGKWPQKVKISKTLASLELLCMEIGSRVWAVRVARKEKKIIKGTWPRYFTTTWGRNRWYDPTKFGRAVDPRDVITLAKCENKRFMLVTWGSGRILPFSTTWTIAINTAKTRRAACDSHSFYVGQLLLLLLFLNHCDVTTTSCELLRAVFIYYPQSLTAISGRWLWQKYIVREHTYVTGRALARSLIGFP